MGMHDCPFLVVFDINEVLKFAKICFFEEGNITSTGTYMFSHLGRNICGITSNLATMFLIDYFCCISFMLQCPCCFIVYRGSPILSELALFYAITF